MCTGIGIQGGRCSYATHGLRARVSSLPVDTRLGDSFPAFAGARPDGPVSRAIRVASSDKKISQHDAPTSVADRGSAVIVRASRDLGSGVGLKIATAPRSVLACEGSAKRFSAVGRLGGSAYGIGRYRSVAGSGLWCADGRIPVRGRGCSGRVDRLRVGRQARRSRETHARHRQCGGGHRWRGGRGRSCLPRGKASRCPGRAEQGCALIAAACLVARDASPAMVVGLGVGGGAYVAYWLSQRQSGAATVPPSGKPRQTGPRSEDRPVLTADEVHEALYGASRNQRLADRYGISLPEPDTDQSDRRP